MVLPQAVIKDSTETTLPFHLFPSLRRLQLKLLICKGRMLGQGRVNQERGGWNNNRLEDNVGNWTMVVKMFYTVLIIHWADSIYGSSSVKRKRSILNSWITRKVVNTDVLYIKKMLKIKPVPNTATNLTDRLDIVKNKITRGEKKKTTHRITLDRN